MFGGEEARSGLLSSHYAAIQPAGAQINGQIQLFLRLWFTCNSLGHIAVHSSSRWSRVQIGTNDYVANASAGRIRQRRRAEKIHQEIFCRFAIGYGETPLATF